MEPIPNAPDEHSPASAEAAGSTAPWRLGAHYVCGWAVLGAAGYPVAWFVHRGDAEAVIEIVNAASREAR